ncbi:MAG: V-type ATP synthase subunit B [Candidatus Micrarchaeota archaeon]|nr:MAG: V-type ATP synthase subunit B [Candidatus Micrarchaeota archaeon]
MIEREYKTIKEVYGPLVVVDKINDAQYNEIVRINVNGEERLGQVIDTTSDFAVVEIFGDNTGLDIESSSVSFTGEPLLFGVSEDMLGRIFNGRGEPIDAKVDYLVREKRDINQTIINPAARAMPNDFIETGISTIDALITLVRGQKLPIFAASGLRYNDLAAQITRQAKVLHKDIEFAVVFAGIGITHDDAQFFIDSFRKTGALSRAVAFINTADDPSIERILTPRLALTTAEYLAFDHGMDVLVIMTDMTNYCEALRELSSARDEVPGRRGYPGYMYTDLATLYERAGLIKGKNGSITQLDILTMPNDDITHPIPDLTGYITEGQIYMSRDLANKGIYPPINPLLSLSRLMNNGIGEGKTRADHRGVADQLFGSYARSIDVRNMSTIIGQDALSDIDKKYLAFGDAFEKRFINQGLYEDRSIEETLSIGWDLLSMLPETELIRIKTEFIKKYYKKS